MCGPGQKERSPHAGILDRSVRPKPQAIVLQPEFPYPALIPVARREGWCGDTGCTPVCQSSLHPIVKVTVPAQTTASRIWCMLFYQSIIHRQRKLRSRKYGLEPTMLSRNHLVFTVLGIECLDLVTASEPWDYWNVRRPPSHSQARQAAGWKGSIPWRYVVAT